MTARKPRKPRAFKVWAVVCRSKTDLLGVFWSHVDARHCVDAFALLRPEIVPAQCTLDPPRKKGGRV